MSGKKFGWSWKSILFWHYNLSSASRFVTMCGDHLRAYGFSIPFTQFGIFIIRKVKNGEDV